MLNSMTEEQAAIQKQIWAAQDKKVVQDAVGLNDTDPATDFLTSIKSASVTKAFEEVETAAQLQALVAGIDNEDLLSELAVEGKLAAYYDYLVSLQQMQEDFIFGLTPEITNADALGILENTFAEWGLTLPQTTGDLQALILAGGLTTDQLKLLADQQELVGAAYEEQNKLYEDQSEILNEVIDKLQGFSDAAQSLSDSLQEDIDDLLDINPDLGLMKQKTMAALAGAANEDQYQDALDMAAEYHQAILANLEDEKQAVIDKYQEQAQAMQTMQSAIESIVDWVEQMKGAADSLLNPQQQLQSVKAQYESTLALAKTGDTDALQDVTGLASNYLSQAGAQASTDFDYQLLYGSIVAEMDTLSKEQEVGLGDTEQKLKDLEALQKKEIENLEIQAANQLKALQDGVGDMKLKLDTQVEALKLQTDAIVNTLLTMSAEQIAAITALSAEEINALIASSALEVETASSLSAAEMSLINELTGLQIQSVKDLTLMGVDAWQNGLKTATKEIVDALYDTKQEEVYDYGNYQSSIAQYTPQSSTTPDPYGINDIFKKLFGRSATGAGINYWTSLYADGVFGSYNQLMESILYSASSSDKAAYNKLMSTGGYATGGIAEGPTSGYPVTLHGREAIIPLGDGNSLTIDQSDLIEEVIALRQEVSELRHEQQRQHNASHQVQRDTRDVLEKWDTTGKPQDREAA